MKGFVDSEGARLYELELYELGYRSPDPLIIDFYDLYNHDEELAAKLIENPAQALREFEDAVNNRVHIRHLIVETPIREIKTESLGRFIMATGIVVRAGRETSKIHRAAFECTGCGETHLVKQNHQFLQRPQSRCGCKFRTKSWRLSLKESTYRDSQTISVQESPDQLPPGEIPQSLEVSLDEELVGSVKPGDRVEITGLVYVKMKAPQSPKLELARFLIANHVEVINRELDVLKLTETDKAWLLELSKDPWIMSLVVNSIAPSIYGHHTIKKAIALQQFGADATEKPDIRIRGDINILLVGDPGISKSQLLKFAANLSSRGIYTTGRGSTEVGLTAAVIKDKGGTFNLEAGAFVLADKGLVAVDEFDKMNEKDRGALHPAMEQQIVTINKGGINATLNARCSVLAAANPTLGRYNAYQTVAENIKTFPISLLNRFDLIFIMRDEPEEETDKATGETILSLMGKQAPIDFKTLKQYIAYSKTVKPTIPAEVSQHLIAFYVEMRKTAKKKGDAAAVMITPRQLESLVRLMLAHARLHFRPQATVEDAIAAIELFKVSMEQVGIDPETGGYDIDLIETGKPRSLQNKLFLLLQIIDSLCKIEGVARVDEVKRTLAEAHRIAEPEASKLISTCMRDGAIFAPRPGYYKRTS